MSGITVLHICYIDNNKCNGVSTVVPKYYMHQKKLCNVGILNCTSTKIDALKKEKNLFFYNDFSNISELPYPFNKPDLVVFHEVYKMKYLSLYKKLIKDNIPYIIIPHGCLTEDAQRIKKTKKTVSNCLFFNRFIKNALSIQFLSSHEKDMSKKYARKCFVAGNGIDVTSDCRKRTRKKNIRIIYVGRYSIYHKGLDLLLEYCKNNKDILSDYRIVFDLYGVGEKNDEDLMRSFVSNNMLSNIIKINGPLFDNDKIKKLRNCDFFIQLSRLEGQPLGLMEALANGIPVIVSDGTTFGDAVKTNNCGYTCNSSIDFAIIMKNIPFLSESDYAKLSSNSIKMMRRLFDWEEVSSSTINIYKKITTDRTLYGF